MMHISLNIFEANSLTVILFRIIRGEGGNLEARWSRKAQAQQVQNFIYLYESDTVIWSHKCYCYSLKCWARMAKMQHWIGRDAQAEVNCHPIILFLKLGAPIEMNYYAGVTLKRTAFGLDCSEPEVAEELTHYSQVCFLTSHVNLINFRMHFNWIFRKCRYTDAAGNRKQAAGMMLKHSF